MKITLPVLVAALIATAAAAQEPPPAAGQEQGRTPSPARQACRSSVMALCATEALGGDRKAVRQCLIRNLDKAAPECQAAVKAAMAARQAARAGDHTPEAAPKQN